MPRSGIPEPWRDDLTQQVDMDGCMVCGSPTQSHLLLFVWDEDGGIFRPVTDHGEADAYGHVCHGCYTDEDGDHGPILQQYTVRCHDLCTKYDVDVSMLVDQPDTVQDLMDADDWEQL